MEALEGMLNKCPLKGTDDFLRLTELVAGRPNYGQLNQEEKARLEEELSIVCKTNTACVFLFFNDIVRNLKEAGATFHGIAHCSYLCYFLGLTKVDPMLYNLPFERYFSVNRRHLPQATLVVRKGAKGQAIRYLKQRYGVDKVARLQDSLDEYVISSKSLLDVGEVKQTILHAAVGEQAWHEDVVSLTWRESIALGLYTILIQEGEVGLVRRFSEEEIYQRALEWFEEYKGKEFRVGLKYNGNERVNAIFANTDGQYIYQEQFYEICTQILGVDKEKADVFRKALLLRKKNQVEEMKKLLIQNIGEEEGLGLFDYIKGQHLHVVSKAYVIGLLFLSL